jgi:predicted ATPase
MRLATLYVRFFRSFNYDLVRKANPKAEPAPWEEVDGEWYPFHKVPLDPVITAVVGANESGKTHLISAVRAALTGTGYDESDFCRYSALYSAEKGKRRRPDFGLDLVADAEDVVALAEVGLEFGDEFTFLRLNGESAQVAAPGEDPTELTDDQLAAIEQRLPRPFRLKTNVAIPKSVSFDVLTGREPTVLSRRPRRTRFLEALRGHEGAEGIRGVADELAEFLDPADSSEEERKRQADADDLARTLLLGVVNLSPDAFRELEQAVHSEEEGDATALVDTMNRSIARRLNISRWWSQDEAFALEIAAREHEVSFTVKDKTGTSYSFDERSRGLRYFLGYYVQLKAHEAERDGPEVLLMDEPDAFLSNIGQQDLLRLFEEFARPETGGREDQVIYVTHSPFLINKNAAHRLRALEKGSDEQGTRVVRDATQNHYEPIRSAVGGFVAETAFIGGANLFVEGIADQILLSAMSSLLHAENYPPALVIDLNAVTIVPCGGAPQVPYMAYLARGRGGPRPPCVALLDGDAPGRAAIKRLLRDDLDGRPIVDSRFIVDIGEWAADRSLQTAPGVEVREPEDLIPLSLLHVAAQNYARHFVGVDQQAASALKSADIKGGIAANAGSAWKGLKSAFAERFDGRDIDKVGFARELVDLLTSGDSASKPAGTMGMIENFRQLIRTLAELLRDAQLEEVVRRRDRQIDDYIKGFARDHPETARKDQADEVLRLIERSLEDTPDDDAIRLRARSMRREFGLKPEAIDDVPDYSSFLDGLGGLRQQPTVAREEDS